MVETDSETCDHPAALRRHLGKGLYGCLDCGHTSHLEGRPYFCGTCPDVHSQTWEEITAHYKSLHPHLFGIKEAT